MTRNILWISLSVVAIASTAAVLKIAARPEVSLPAGPATDPSAEPVGTNVSPLSVSVVSVDVADVQPTLRAHGVVEAQYRTTLVAEVAGTLDSVDARAHSGGRVARGSVLMTLDDWRHQRAVAQAQADLGQARSRRVEEELLAEQAARDWQRIGGPDQPSDYLLRAPQKESASLEVQAREAALVEALEKLSRTTVRAPFDAVVVRRIAALGSHVQPGTELIELYSSERVELRLPLKNEDWALLPPEAELLKRRWPVELSSNKGASGVWQGTVQRIERHVTAETRQRALVVIVENPLDQDPPLYPGTFVRAALGGRKLEGMLDLPASAMTEKQEIWFVDADDVLARARVEPLQAAEGRILVKAPAGLRHLEILAHPMLSYVPGLKVRREVTHAPPR